MLHNDQIRPGWALAILWRNTKNGLVPLLIGTLALVAVTLALIYYEGAVGMYLFTITPVVMPMLAAVVTLFIAFGVAWSGYKGAMIRAALGNRHCPACDYEIGHVRPSQIDAAGLCRCPECGAAWRSERLGVLTREEPEVVTVRF